MDVLIPDFEIFTGDITPASKDINGRALFASLPQETDEAPHVFMTGSSTEQDLHGDTMMPGALQDMTKAQPGLCFWLNHDYTVPYSYFGKMLASPVIVQHEGVADLHLASDVAMRNSAAADTFAHIKDGAHFGCSGGFQILEWAFDGDDWFSPILIYGVLALEWSVVGIPANQRSWVEKGIAGLFKRMVREDRGEEAIKLAPAFKSMYRNDYRELVKSLTSEGLRKDLEAAPVRPASPNRLTWEPLTKSFVFSSNNRKQALEQTEVATLLKSIAKPAALMQKSATLKTSWPLADYDTKWDGPEAEKQIFAWANDGDDDSDFIPSKAKQCFLFCDTDNQDKREAYKGPCCHISDGKPEIVPQAAISCADILNGAMGGFKDVSEEDIAAGKGKIKTIYNRINKEQGKDLTVPWEEKKDDEKAVKPETTKDVQENPEEQQEIEQATEEMPETHEEEPASTLEQKSLLMNDENALLAFLKKQGFVPAAPVEPSDEMKNLMVKALEFAITVKEAREFSKENEGYIQAIHDALTSMKGTDMCAAAINGEDRSDEDENMEQQASFEPVLKSVDSLKTLIGEIPTALNALVETFKGVPVLQAHMAVMTKHAEALDLKFKQAQEQVNAVNADLHVLTNRPLGKPTHLNTKVAPVADMQDATYEDMLSVNNLPAFHGTLEDALKQTTREEIKLLDGQTLALRCWPAGIGGSGAEGVRPALTWKQKNYMQYPEWVAYEAGDEARVPMVDDPAPNVYQSAG